MMEQLGQGKITHDQATGHLRKHFRQILLEQPTEKVAPQAE